MHAINCALFDILPLTFTYIQFNFIFNRFIDEIAALLDGLEKRQAALDQENTELKKDLAAAKAQIEEGDKLRADLEERLAKNQPQS